MRALPIVAGFVAVHATLYYLGRTWGTTTAERQQALRGDELIPDAKFGGDHAITISAPPSDVWPWLVQVGWGRGGWYTYRWVDKLLFPHNGPSADEIVAEWQHLKPGDHVPDGPPELGCYFVVEALEPQKHLVLRSTTHLPPQLLNREDIGVNWTWAFVLSSESESDTRFHFRWRATARPRLLRCAFDLLITPLDFVMGRSMCKGLKKRVEARKPQDTAER